ncbi:hypothetical protein O9895_18570 [Clostridioides difficile]|nr:hypothetical protein [Clostridioides difficile]
MNQIAKVLSGICMLITIYLFLSKGTQTVNIINSLGKNSVSGIKTLQGR